MDTVRQARKDKLAIAIVACNLALASFMTNIGFIAAFSGAVVSGVIIFVYPPLFHMRVLEMRAASRGARHLVLSNSTSPPQNPAIGKGVMEEAEMLGQEEQQHTWKYAAPLVWEGSEKKQWYCSLAICLMGLSLSSLGLATVLEII